MSKARRTHEVKVRTGLPPMVPGDTRGVLYLKFPSLKWDCSTPPPAPRLCVLLKWWGENTEGCVFRVPIEYKQKLHPSIQPSTAQYPIFSNWKQFQSYLEDMGHLTVIVGLGRTPDDLLIMGECVVPHLASINPDKLEKRTSTVVTIGDGKVHLGRLSVEILVKMNTSKHTAKRSHHPAAASRRLDGANLRVPTTKPQPLRGSDSQATPTNSPQSASVHVITVPANSKEWKPVKRVKFSSGCSQTDQSDHIPLGGVAKQMVSDLLDRAKTLHEDMVSAVSNVGSSNEEESSRNEEEKTVKTVKMKTPVNIPEEGDSVYEVTPPSSPTESMLEMEANLCINTVEEKDNVEAGAILEKKTKKKSGHCVAFVPDSVQYLQSQNEIGTQPQYGTVFVTTCAKLPAPTNPLPLPKVDLTKDLKVFHILLEIPEGSSIFNPSDPTALPNVYIQCRLFCSQTPLQSRVFCGTREPKIGIKQVFPVCMGWNDLLKYLDGGYAVIEAWDLFQEEDHPITTSEEEVPPTCDELIGLVKVSLQPLHTAVWSTLHNPSYESSLFPVVAMDSYCPIKDPITGKTCGHLAVKLIMGTPDVIPAKMGYTSCEVHTSEEFTKDIADDSYVSVLEETSEEKDGVEKEREERIEEGEEERREDTSEEEETEEHEEGSVREEVLLPLREHTYTESAEEQSSSAAECCHKDMLQLELLISQALHLPLLTTPLETSHSVPRAYVTCHPHPSVGKVTTHVSMATTKPRWEHQCTISIPHSCIDAAMCELEFQVWSLPPQDQETHQLSVNPKTHTFLGRAFVDLVPLQYGLRSLVGWYNMADLAGEVHGQLKIAITPKDRIPPRRELQSNHFSFQSRSLLPVQIGLYSSEISSTISVCDKTMIELPKLTYNDEHSRSLSFLRQQLQSHVADLESIQESLEAKLKDPPSSDAPEQPPPPSTLTSITSPNTTLGTHPPLTSPSLRDEDTTDSHNSAGTSPDHFNDGCRDNFTPILSHDESVYPIKMTTPPSCDLGTNKSPPPIEMPEPNITSSPRPENVVELEAVDGSHLEDTMLLSQSIMTNEGEGLVQTSTADQTTESIDDGELEMKNIDKDSNQQQEVLDADNGVQEAEGYVINKMELSSEGCILTRTDWEQRSTGLIDEVGKTLPLSEPSTEEEKEEEERDKELSDTMSETSLCSSDITRKIEVLKRQEQDNKDDSDTSILEEDSDLIRPTALPSCDEDDLEEEEEVKRLFNRLLKERDYSDNVHSSSPSSVTEGTGSSSSASTDIESESEHDNESNDAEEVKIVPMKAANIQQRRPNCDDQLPSYFLPEKKLAEKLLALRHSALNRLPPRPLQTNQGPREVDNDPLVQNPIIKRFNPPHIKTPERERLKRIFHS